MSIIKKEFGTLSGASIYSYTLDNGCGLSAEILTLGGTLRSLVYNGTDVVLGYADTQHYYKCPTYFGALVGRNCNRLEGGEFTLGDNTYKLAINDTRTGSNLHGGFDGFNAKIWDAEAIDAKEPKLILKTFSPDGEEGFPANVNITVTYTLTSYNAIRIHYEGTTDGDTILNMTNHAYFNLNGHLSGSAENHILKINSSCYTPLGKNGVPDGSVLLTENTPFDFRSPKPVLRDKPDGYDHNFAIDGRGFREFAVLEGDISHIVMTCSCDLPAVQLFTGGGIGGEGTKDGAVYGDFQGICLETQMFPNAMKHSHYPSPILKKGEKYDTVTEYKFSVK